jgi:transposase
MLNRGIRFISEINKYMDEFKEQIQDLDFEQIKALKERFESVIIKRIG